MAVLDPVADFIELTVLQGYDAAATQVDIVSTDTHFDLLPDPTTDGAYNLLWYDATNYGTNPQDDPNKEWVRVTNWTESAHRLVVTRAQQGTAATTKNTASANYKMIMAIGAKLRNDIEASTLDVGSAYGWLPDYGGVGDGVAADDLAFIAAYTAGITHLVVPEGTWRFTQDLTIPTSGTAALVMHRNAIIAPDTGKTVTINAFIIAGNYQIFGGIGTVTVAVGSNQRNLMRYTRWWGTNSDTMQLTSADNNKILDITQEGAAGAVTITQTGAGIPLTIAGTNGNCINIATEKTPATAAATGTKGTICWDSGAIYVCVATDTWKKIAIATW